MSEFTNVIAIKRNTLDLGNIEEYIKDNKWSSFIIDVNPEWSALLLDYEKVDYSRASKLISEYAKVPAIFYCCNDFGWLYELYTEGHLTSKLEVDYEIDQIVSDLESFNLEALVNVGGTESKLKIFQRLLDDTEVLPETLFEFSEVFIEAFHFDRFVSFNFSDLQSETKSFLEQYGIRPIYKKKKINPVTIIKKMLKGPFEEKGYMMKIGKGKNYDIAFFKVNEGVNAGIEFYVGGRSGVQYSFKTLDRYGRENLNKVLPRDKYHYNRDSGLKALELYLEETKFIFLTYVDPYIMSHWIPPIDYELVKREFIDIEMARRSFHRVTIRANDENVIDTQYSDGKRTIKIARNSEGSLAFRFTDGDKSFPLTRELYIKYMDEYNEDINLFIESEDDFKGAIQRVLEYMDRYYLNI